MLLLCSLFTLIFSSRLSAESSLLTREVPSIEMEMNNSYILSLSPYFFNPRGISAMKVQIGQGKSITGTYNSLTHHLKLVPQRDWHGLDRLVLKITDKSPLLKGKKQTAEFALLVKVRKKSTTIFKFKPDTPVQKVYVAGDFNGWNANANIMNGPDKEGVYTLFLNLPGGSYGYKFVADGKWTPDANNPNKKPDGFGGHNSILNVALAKSPQLFGTEKNVSWDNASQKGNIEVLIEYKPADENGPPIDPKSISALLNGNLLSSKKYQWSSTSQTLSVHLDNLPPGNHSVRILAADTEGNPSNEIYFLEMMGEYRSQDDWRDAVIYSIVTDRFFNGDKSNDKPNEDPAVPAAFNYQGGDWEGIIQKIKSGYFTELGVNALWISPVVDNPETAFPQESDPKKKVTGYHGYWPITLERSEEHFGTMEKLKELVSTAHQNGLKVILDAVLNHVHEDHPLYKAKPHWFAPLTLPDGRKNLHLFDERPLDTWFTEFMPDIDYDKNPDAIQSLVNNTLWWIEQTDADGLRLDAVKHMPHSFWKSLRRALNQKIELPRKKTFYLVGETISSRDMILRYIGDEELHGQFDFPLCWAIRDTFAWETADFVRLESERNISEEFYGNALMGNILGNHDFVRFISYADGDITPENSSRSEEIGWVNAPVVNDPLSYQKLRLAFAFLLTQSGIPTIYYGDEIGLAGAGDPDNRRMMKFGADLNENEKATFNFIKQMLSIRKKNPSLRMGRHVNLIVEKDIYLYQKEFFQNRTVIGFNRGKTSRSVEFSIPGVKGWKNLLNNAIHIPDEKGVTRFSLESYEAAVLLPI